MIKRKDLIPYSQCLVTALLGAEANDGQQVGVTGEVSSEMYRAWLSGRQKVLGGRLEAIRSQMGRWSQPCLPQRTGQVFELFQSQGSLQAACRQPHSTARYLTSTQVLHS